MSRGFHEGKGETVDAQVGELVLTAVVVVWAVTIMYWDFSFQRIPNALTLPAIAIAVGLGLWLHPFALVSGAACAGMYYVLYRQRGVGAGDVKLVASLGVLIGGDGLLPVYFAVAAANLLTLIPLLLSQSRQVAHGPWLLISCAILVVVVPECWLLGRMS